MKRNKLIRRRGISGTLVMGRAPCCDKANVKKGPWSPEEDAKLKTYIEQHGTGGNWITLPQKIGLKRCGKSCRLRWLNYLRPNIKHGGFSDEEDNVICSLYLSIGSRWSIIAAQLPGRTDNDIKNYWNTRLKKKLLGKPRNDNLQNRRSSKEIRPTQAENDFTCQAPYWPENPVPLTSHIHLQSDDNSPLRNFLVKLCTRIAGENTPSVHNSLGVPYAVPQVYEDLQDLMETSTWTPFADESSSLEGAFSRETSGCFDPEFEQVLYSEHMKAEGIDRLWGLGCISSSESSSWNHVSTLMCAPLDEQVQLETC